MAIDHGIQSGQMSDNFIAAVSLCGIFPISQVGHQDHIVRTLLFHVVDIALQAGVKCFPGLIRLEIIHGDSLIIDHITDLGFTECIRSIHTDKSHFRISAFQDSVWIINRFSVRSAEVRADIAAFQLLSQVIQHFKTIIKLMIPKDSNIVSRLIHDTDEFFSLRDCADRRPLDGIPGIYQDDMLVLLLQLFRIEHQPVISNIPVIIAVHIIGKQNRDCRILFLRGIRCQGGDNKNCLE